MWTWLGTMALLSLLSQAQAAGESAPAGSEEEPNKTFSRPDLPLLPTDALRPQHVSAVSNPHRRGLHNHDCSSTGFDMKRA